MKMITALLLSPLLTATALANHCKVGDLTECASVLKRLHQGDSPAQMKKFSLAFDEICGENKKFKCIKKIVRGDMTEELKYTGQDHPAAHLYVVKLADESYIYILEGK